MKLESCIDEIRNVIGDAASDRQLTATVLRNNFDAEKSLAEILNEMSQKQEPQLKVNEKKGTIEKGEYFLLIENWIANSLYNGYFTFSFSYRAHLS